jgi:hypothetical protein
MSPVVNVVIEPPLNGIGEEITEIGIKFWGMVNGFGDDMS